MADEKKAAEVVVPPVVVAEVAVPPVEEKDELTLTKEALAKAEADRDNYKTVALKRLGKLPADAEFLNKEGAEELTVEEQVRLALLDREVEAALKAKDAAADKILKENSELRLALKNQPGSGLGGGSSETGPEVKDNVFSEAQLVDLRKRATRIGADPEKFIAQAKDAILARR